MESQFENFGLLPELLQAVEKMGFEQPTPIQSAAIPVLLAGRDVIGQAQTGTGKTAAFVLPMLQTVPTGNRLPQALVLAPTRELAIQVAEATIRMGQQTGVRVVAVYGGQAYHLQTRQLQRGVDVVVATPGRLLDLIRQNLIDLSQVRHLVLDEADEMLEMGFIEDVEAILNAIPSERQTALFSATLPDAIRKLAERYLHEPEQIRINPKRLTVAETEQRYCRVREENKLAALTRMLQVEDVNSALIFTRTKARAQELADALVARGYPAESLHGDLNQSRREFVLNRFRHHAVTLLVATDVAARGLDIENVTHVFNYDIPLDPEDYVHRIGRTGRAGRKGVAISFISPRERFRLGQIEAYTRQKIAEVSVPTPQQIQSSQDARFLDRLSEQLAQGDLDQARDLLGGFAGSEYSLEDIAAAAILLARSNEKDIHVEDLLPNEPEPRASRRSRAPEGARNSSRFDKKRGHARGMIRLRMELGNAQGLRPSDVVGAIASEVGIPGRAIGEIDIRRNHTFVDVSEKHVRKVLRESNGRYTLHGKPVTLKLAN